MSEVQFASTVIRIWRLRQRIAQGATKKQIGAARRKLWALATQIAYTPEPRR